MKKILLFLALVIALAACQEQKVPQKEPASKQTAKSTAKKQTPPRTVTIYRYGNFPLATAKALQKELKKTFPEVKLADKILSLPADSYVKERNRYRASALTKDLKNYQHGDAVIGLTDQIICHSNEISPTFGIMGLSPMGTYRSVVSSKIPRNGKTQNIDNFVKLALHELGHAYGLPHCPDQHCYMVDAEHKMKLPQTTGFCKKCRSKLQSDGWTL